MMDAVLTGKHRPARVDIPRAGVSSGVDTMLPGPCATATCHHKDHQLRGGGWCVPTDCQAGVCTTAMKHEPTCPKPGWGYDSPPWDGTMVDLPTVGARGGWCMPSSSYFISPGRFHDVVIERRWWQFWKPRIEVWPASCTDQECLLEHWNVDPLAQTVPGIPLVHVQRGGIRFGTGRGGTV